MAFFFQQFLVQGTMEILQKIKNKSFKDEINSKEGLTTSIF